MRASHPREKRACAIGSTVPQDNVETGADHRLRPARGHRHAAIGPRQERGGAPKPNKQPRRPSGRSCRAGGVDRVLIVLCEPRTALYLTAINSVNPGLLLEF